MAALLAASLKFNLRCEYELVAAIPVGFDQPTPATLEFLTSIGVRCLPIANVIGVHYPIGNKLSCMDIESTAQKIVFLDSDVLCTAEFHHQENFSNYQFLAKLTDLADLSLDDWRIIHQALDIKFPKTFYRSTVTDAEIPLVFNAGFIAVDNGLDFGSEWIRMAQMLEAVSDLPGKRPFLDQLSLGFVLQHLELSFKLLDEPYNFPAEIRPIDPLHVPYFCHYHHLSHILAESFSTGLVNRLIGEYRLLSKVEFPPALRATISGKQ